MPQGPYPETELRDLIAKATVTAETLVWSGGMTGWRKAEEIPGMLSGYSGPPTVSPGQPLMSSGGSDGGSLSIELGSCSCPLSKFVRWGDTN
jgi:GYF domain 2